MASHPDANPDSLPPARSDDVEQVSPAPARPAEDVDGDATRSGEEDAV